MTLPKIMIIIIIIYSLEGSREVYWVGCPGMCRILSSERKELGRMVSIIVRCLQNRRKCFHK